MLFRDVLYGEISLPEWLEPFLRLPEFVRLRGVRLSNIDSLQFKDFGSATRYDHALGVVHLALNVACVRRLSKSDTVHLALAALLHDVGTPPFAHTLEIIFDDVDHELELWNALGLDPREQDIGFNAYDGELPRFVKRCKVISTSLGCSINPEKVGRIIGGEGELGFLIKGFIDLDNIDNVIRGTHYMGFPSASGHLAESIAAWLATLDKQPTFDGCLPEVALSWIQLRDEYYRLFFDSTDAEKARQALLQFVIRESARLGFPKERMLKTTDEGLLYSIADFAKQNSQGTQILSDAVRKFRHLEPINKVAEFPIYDKEILNSFEAKTSIDWMEKELRRPGFVPMLFFSKRRFSDQLSPKRSLFSYPSGCLSVFTLYEQKHDRPGKLGERNGLVAGELQKRIMTFAIQKPWRVATKKVREDLRESLNSWGDWSFIGSRNDPFHAYPSTFVHAIPSAFIKSLRLSGDTLLYSFCGSGVTGIEAVKLGCRVVCADINEVALLISRVRTTYLSMEQRTWLRSRGTVKFNVSPSVDLPKIDNLHKWHLIQRLLRNFL